MIEKYITICNLLELTGPAFPHLEQVQTIIRQPDFRYEKNECPEILENVFLASSYWLDRELFDESYLYRKKNHHLTSTQEVHLTMTDIGSTLIDKGFSIEYIPEEYIEIGPHHLAEYVKTFAEQCHKRNTFLHAKIPHKINAKKIICHRIDDRQH
ncbi:MAG: hypothetical protein IKQ99_00350 [Alphaproteobacteria bacterium]|nr:hypothetical protein [Alphaproteobacteria bacterium]